MKLELGNYEMDMISHEPLVYTLKGVLTELECQHFINISSDKMKRSSVSGYDEKNKRKDELDNRRTSSSCWVTHDDNSITREVVERISKLVQIPSSHSEAYQVVHYENSQEYQPHLDTFDPKPQNQEVQGPTPVINTSADGIQISGFLPKTAAMMRYITLFRGMQTNQGAHEQGQYLLHRS